MCVGHGVHVVLRGKCISVDEPVQGSTPALVIPDSLTTPTPKYSLTIGGVFTIAGAVSFADLHLQQTNKTE